MSYNISNPVTDSSVATKAAKDGSDFTNPSTWRTNMSVPSTTEVFLIDEELSIVAGRALRGGIAFDGFSSGHFVQNTIGSLGTSDLSWRLTFRCPTTTSGSPYVAALMSSATAAAGYSLVAYFSGTTLKVELWAASASHARILSLTDFATTYGGKIVQLVAVKNVTASTMTLYVNGVAVSGSASTIGTPPAWSGTVNSVVQTLGNYRNSGTNPLAGTLYSATIFNRVLTAAEVLSLAKSGIPEEDKWASLTELTSGTLSQGKRYRIKTFVSGDSFTNLGAASNATGVEFVTTGTTPTTWTNASVLVQIGVLLDPDLAVGVGYQAPDRSANNYHGEMSTGGVAHTVEKYDGEHSIVKTLAHSDISSTAATTVLLTLPKNCGLIEVEFDRTTAFDSGITVDVGISGTQAKHVSAQSLVGTTIVLADSLSKASESNSANVTVYIKKSGATTVGAVTVRATYRIRNK